MRVSQKEPLDDPAWAWRRFEPTGKRPWDAQSVAHLHRRAGFAAFLLFIYRSALQRSYS